MEDRRVSVTAHADIPDHAEYLHLCSLYISSPFLLSFSNVLGVILARDGRHLRPSPGEIPSMSVVSDHFDPATLSDRLRNANVVTRELISEVVDKACRRFPSFGQNERTSRLTRLIDAEAWSDAALALLELELPLWQVRRIAYDEGEWYCALSRERELPDWLDASVEARHENLALALLTAFAEVQALTAAATRPSVPSVPRAPGPLYQPISCDNFG
jgi:hypothetical protein